MTKWEACKNGEPIARPLWTDAPEPPSDDEDPGRQISEGGDYLGAIIIWALAVAIVTLAAVVGVSS